MPDSVQPRFLLAPCLWFLAAAAAPDARVFFAERQVLGPELDLDLLVFLPPGDSALAPAPAASAPADSSASAPPDIFSGHAIAPPPWDCASVKSGFAVASCALLPFRRTQALREEYFISAFPELSRHSRPAQFAAHTEHHAIIDALPRPLVALRKRADSCQYLIVHPDAYVPVAAGQVPCPDLGAALDGLHRDLAGRTRRVRKGPIDRQEKIYGSSSKIVPDRSPSLDIGIEGALALAIMLSGDTEKDLGSMTFRTEKFDLGDLAVHDGLPVSGRLFLLYRKSVGFRLGYEYGGLSLTDAALNAFRSELPDSGLSLDAWRIRRHTLSGELMLGRGFRSGGQEIYVGGLLGIRRTLYSETITVNGREEDAPGLLEDVPGLTLGAQLQIRVFDLIQFGLETSLDLKPFELENSALQPDGTASEIQFRLVLGFHHAFRFAAASG